MAAIVFSSYFLHNFLSWQNWKLVHCVHPQVLRLLKKFLINSESKKVENQEPAPKFYEINFSHRWFEVNNYTYGVIQDHGQISE